MRTALLCIFLLSALVRTVCAQSGGSKPADSPQEQSVVLVDPSHNFGVWEGWGSSLAWWARAIGGTANADEYADLIYSTGLVHGYPGLGLNIVRYNLGGGGVRQPKENKGAKLEWQMDIHGYWTDETSAEPTSSSWNWSLDSNQRTIMRKAQQRGANVFELFSDSPMWWMNSNHSTAGSLTGGDCLSRANYQEFATYLATVVKHANDHWGIQFRSVEPFNEPSADWWKFPIRQEGCHFDRKTQEIVIDQLRTTLDHSGLKNVSIAAADENDVDAALGTWNTYDGHTREAVGKVNVHGYFRGGDPYRGQNRVPLRNAVGTKPLWVSEYGDGDASGMMLAESILQDIRDLHPRAWVYWQPVEPDVPEFGWGLINADYVDTGDIPNEKLSTRLVRVNRKFFVYGQFTRYLRPGYRILQTSDEHSIAAYDAKGKRLVIITINTGEQRMANYDLSAFRFVGATARQIATTTAPENGVPDWKQAAEKLSLDRKTFRCDLYPKSIYTFVVDDVRP